MTERREEIVKAMREAQKAGVKVDYDAIKDKLPMKSVLENNDRVTAQVNLYYEQCGEQPKQFSSAFSAIVPQHLDGPYSRRLFVDETFKQVDTGWVDSVSLILIENLTGLGLQVNPTPEEKEAMAKQVVAVSCEAVDDDWLIDPGRFMVAKPGRPIFIRCQSGKTKVRISLLPG